MTTAVNSFLDGYSSRLPRKCASLSPRTVACEGRRTLLLNHVVDRPTARMDLFQLCVNEENRQAAAVKVIQKQRKPNGKRNSCYGIIPKAHLNSKILLKRQTQEQLVDAKIVEKVRFSRPGCEISQFTVASSAQETDSLTKHGTKEDHIYVHDAAVPQLPPLEASLTPTQLLFCADLEALFS